MHSVWEKIDNLFQQYNNILIIGIGNPLRSDDKVGLFICDNLKETNKIKTLKIESSIERYIFTINRLKNDAIIMIDAADIRKEPGKFDLIEIEKFTDTTWHTHNVSLKKIASQFLQKTTWILGIQPQSISIGENLTSKVKKTAKLIIKNFNLLSKKY